MNEGVNMFKKQHILFALSSFFLCSSPAFSQSTDRGPLPLITLEQKIEIYNTEKATTEVPALLNILPLGIGSFYQGDLTSGIIITAIDLVSIGMIAYGIQNSTPTNIETALIVFQLGSILYCIGIGFGLTSVSNHAEQYNAELLERLHLDKSQLPQEPHTDNWTEALTQFYDSLSF